MPAQPPSGAITMTSDKFLSRVRAWRRQRFGVPPADQSAREMAAWFGTPLGQAMLAAEKLTLEGALQDLFGYHLLQIGVDPALDMTGSSRITHRVTIALSDAGAGSLSSLIADPRQLPLPSGSVDLSRHVARLFSRHALWRHQPLRLGRLLDWLQLLDLEPDRVQRGFYRPALQHPGALRRLQWCDQWGKRLHLPGGAFYQVLACKELGGAVPVKPAWERRPSSLPGLGAQPMRKDQKY